MHASTAVIKPRLHLVKHWLNETKYIHKDTNVPPSTNVYDSEIPML